MVKRFPVIYLTDRSAAETDDKCPRKYYWNRLYQGKGVVPVEEALALRIGRETHRDLEVVSELEDLSTPNIQKLIDEIIEPLTEEDRQHVGNMELVWRRLGWLAAFAVYMEPAIRERYTTVGVEKEIILDRSPLWVATTPDRILRDKQSGKLIYWDYKSTITANQKWIESWHYKIQLHIGMKAIAEELEEEVAYAQVMGLMKGDKRGEFQRLSHPYVWGWYNTSTKEWSCEYQRGGDWQHTPVWEYPRGIIEWVKFCGEEVAKSQFPFTYPVMLNERMLDLWVDRRRYREQMIKWNENTLDHSKAMRNQFFPMMQDQCRPPFGDPCPYRRLCWTADGENTALEKGDFIPRTPHHTVEEVGVDHE